MRTPLETEKCNNDDEDVKNILTSPESSTSMQLLDPTGNKIGEVELNTYENFPYASESFSTTIDRIVWGEEDTNLLLEKYELYISQVGPRKRFQSKKNMWNQIANDIYIRFKLIFSGAQCENRFKTVSKRKKQSTDNNFKQNNAKASSTTEDERIIVTEELAESEVIRNGGIQMNLEKLEQTNQELSQQVEQTNVRFATMIEKFEKHNNRQQQKLERLIQETKEQVKTEFTMLIEKLDTIHNTIQQNQEQQLLILQQLIKENHEEHKTEFNTFIDVLGKIHNSIKSDSHSTKKSGEHICTMKPGEDVELRRSRSHSRSRRKSSKRQNSHSPHRKRRCSSNTSSHSTSNYRYKSPPPSQMSKHSKFDEKHNSKSRSLKIGNNQCTSHPSRSSCHDHTHKSKSRSPRRSTHRSCTDSSCKQRDKHR